jgi:hypothetical protein
MRRVMFRGLLVGALLGALTAGCAQVNTIGAQEKKCFQRDCPEIVVDVINGAIVLDAETLSVRKNNNNVNLFWNLDPSTGYEFRDDSIQFKEAERAAQQFRFQNQNGKMIHYRDLNSDRRDYGYTIVVYNKTTGQPLRKDPIIANQGF